MLRLCAATAATLAALAPGLVAPPTAQAAYGPLHVYYGGSTSTESTGSLRVERDHPYMFGSAKENSGNVYVADQEEDGYRVGLYFRVHNSTFHGICVDKNGSYNGILKCSDVLPDSETITIKVGICKGGSDAACDEIGDWGTWSDPATGPTGINGGPSGGGGSWRPSN